MVGRLLLWAFKLTIITAILVFLIQFWLLNKSYVFSDSAVAAIAKKHLAVKDAEAMFRKIHGEFRKQYPGHILPQKDLQWTFVNAGGWMGSMCLLHASLTEYVLFFGTPIETSGHSGRYWANISDTVLTGTFKQWPESSMNVNVYKPGDTIMHAWGEATAVNFAAGTWMVEYGRGFIPSTLGFALADTLFSTQDFLTLFYTFRIYFKALLLEANVNIAQGFDYVKSQLT